VTIIEASAAECYAALAEHGALPVDVVLSGLPFTSLPRSVTHAILQATVRSLQPDGVFITYQYSTLLRGVLQHYFPSLRITRFVLRNVPPAFVFTGSSGPS
jgi:phospholipid N-methyltransferase